MWLITLFYSWMFCNLHCSLVTIFLHVSPWAPPMDHGRIALVDKGAIGSVTDMKSGVMTVEIVSS